jgi:hypothetical protein
MLNRRSILTSLLAAFVLTAPLFAQKDPGPSSFDQTKFEQWQKEGPRAQLSWKVRIASKGLSLHQRLVAHIEIEADADRALKHGKTGQLIAMVELTDSKEKGYQNDGKLELSEMRPDTRNANVIFSWDAFVLPGDYDVALALYDNRTGEHNFGRRKLHIPTLRPDPLPSAWQDLPTVEYWAAKDANATDNLFHPDIDGKLNLHLAARNPVHIELVADLTSLIGIGASHTAYTDYLAAVIPTMKTLGQIDIGNGALDLAFLDLEQRKVTFEQNNVKEVDWPRLKTFIQSSEPGTISVQALNKSHRTSPAFLRDELVRRITTQNGGPVPRGQDPLRVFVLISSPLNPDLFKNLDSNPIPDSLPEKCGCLIYYLEYDFLPFYELSGMDKVKEMLKPLKVRAFSVHSAYDIRHALATMLDEVSKM